MKTNIHFWSYLAHFFLEGDMFQTNVVERIKTNLCVQQFFFHRKSCLLWYNVEKYGAAVQATDDNMAHEHCMIDTKGYKHTLRTYNFFSAVTKVAERTSILRYTYIVCMTTLLVQQPQGQLNST